MNNDSIMVKRFDVNGQFVGVKVLTSKPTPAPAREYASVEEQIKADWYNPMYSADVRDAR